MKIRVLLLITILMLASASATMAQRYKLRMRTTFWCPWNSYRKECSGNQYTAVGFFDDLSKRDLAQKDILSDGRTKGYYVWLEGNCQTNPAIVWDSITFDVSQVLTRIHFYSASDKYSQNDCSNSCKYDKDWYIGNYNSNGYFFGEDVEPSKCYGSNSQIWIFPESIKLTAKENYLPTTDKMTITATPNYPRSVYKWQYNVGGGDNDWVDFPTSTNTFGNSTISVSGHDLMGDDFLTIVGDKNVVIRVSPVYYCVSDPLVLKPTIPSPHITGVTRFPNKCYGVKDGTFTVQFDRQKFPGETLNISLIDNLGTSVHTAVDPSLDAGNTYTFPAMLGPGDYKIELAGNYYGVPCYSEGPQHEATPSLTGPAAVSFNNSGRNVYCFAGADGTITLNATGGVGNYSAGFKQVQDGAYNWNAFGSPGQHTISGLDSGVYQLRIYDGNNCIMKDGAGNEVIQTVTINQPAQPVQVDYRQGTNPLAFGSTDGSAMVIIIGGTPVANNSYNVAWRDSTTGTALTTVTNTTNPFTTKLQQVDDGTYIVTASDANYALASGVNAAGCIVADTFRLQQPPELIVTVEEDHYVTCKNSSDGELYARAQGGIEIPTKRYTYQWFRKDNGSWTNIGQTDSFGIKLTAGTYKIRITDYNNISKESEEFPLAEPNLLTVALTSTQVVCSGGKDGTATAVIAGGTWPYTIEWNNGATTENITGLSTGNYLAYASDARGCQTQQQVKVNTPNPIVINNPVVAQPVCTGYCNGSISYTVSGGTAPYTYQWSNGSAAQTQTALCAGTYTVTITDAAGCWIQQSFNLIDPLPLTIGLGPDRTLCAGQSWPADATIADANAVYSWTGPNGFTAGAPKVSLTVPGEYTVQVTDSKGCKGGGNIVISRSDATVAAEFVSSTQAFKGEKVTFVNISQPRPEKIEWQLPSGNITEQRRTDSLLEIQFNETGIYRIGMKTSVGSCTKEYSNTITIIEGQRFDNPGSLTTDPFVLDYKVAPNPSNGQFTAIVGLREKADISLRLINLQTGATIDQQRKSGDNKYTVSYNINVVGGVYALVLETAKDTRILRVLIL